MGNAISNFFAAAAAFFGWKRERDQRAAAAPQVARAEGANDQEIKDRTAEAIAEGNLDQIRRDLAE